MYESVASIDGGAASARLCVKAGGILSVAAENDYRCNEFPIRDDMASEGQSGRSQPKNPKLPSLTGQHFESSASLEHSRMPDEKNSVNAKVADDFRELESSLVDAATACVSQNRKGCTTLRDMHGAQLDNNGQAEALEHISEGHVAKRDDHEMPFPRPGTKISTILSQAPSNLSNIDRDNESATSFGKESNLASSGLLDHVSVSNNRDPGLSGALPCTLPSAREKLRRLLLGTDRRKFRKSGSRFPPSP